MKQHGLIGVSLAAMVVLAGCQDPANMTEEEREVLRGKETISGNFGRGTADFGNATRANIAVQTVDPAPANVDDPPKVDGQVVIGAFGRYRTGKVKPPRTLAVGGN